MRDARVLAHNCAANHHNYEGVIMTEEKVAQLEHISQLLIFQIKNVHKLIGKAWYELEIARGDLRELMDIYKEWEEENGLNQEQQEQ
jgi:hypothetical protein